MGVHSRSSAFLVLGALGVLATGAWSDVAPSTQRVPGFESSSDWQGASGNSIVHSQGTASAIVPVDGWTQVTSIPLSTIGPVDGTMSVDVLLPAETPYWGEVRAIVKIPSQGEWYRDLGGQSLVGLAAGTFHRLEFSIPPDLTSKLAASYSDLTITVVINAPSGSYLLDRLWLWDEQPPEPDGGVGGMAGTGGSATGGTGNATGAPPGPDCACTDADCATCSTEFVVDVPVGAPVVDVAIAVRQSLKINDRATVRAADGMPAIVTNTGKSATELGVDTLVGSLFSAASITLRNRVRVEGDVWLRYDLSQQEGAVIAGSTGALSRQSRSRRWNVAFPTGEVQDVSLEPDVYLQLARGDYGNVSIKSRARLTLTSGRYTCRSLALEPESGLVLDTTRGSIELYVLGGLTFRGSLLHVGGDGSRVLVGVAGTGDVHLEAPWTGATLVAPNAKVNVSSGLFTGALYAMSAEVFEGVHVVAVPHVRFANDVTPQPVPESPPAALSGGFPKPTVTCVGCEIGADGKASTANCVHWSWNHCYPPLEDGAACSPEEPESGVCAPGLSCQPDLGWGHSCRSAPRLGEACDPDTYPCATHDNDSPPLYCDPTAPNGYHCVPYAMWGGRYENPDCAGDLSPNDGICDISCTTDDNCPQPPWGPPDCRPSGYCYFCEQSIGGNCDNARTGAGCCFPLGCDAPHHGDPGSPYYGPNSAGTCRSVEEVGLCQGDADCMQYVGRADPDPHLPSHCQFYDASPGSGRCKETYAADIAGGLCNSADPPLPGLFCAVDPLNPNLPRSYRYYLHPGERCRDHNQCPSGTCAADGFCTDCPEVVPGLCGMLAAHNAVRAGVGGLLPLVWYADAARVAQAWADQCPYNTSLGHNPDRMGSENMATGRTVQEVFIGWVDSEVMYYDPSTGGCVDWTPAEYPECYDAEGALTCKCGHYALIISDRAVFVGCGVNFECASPNWVCDFP